MWVTVDIAVSVGEPELAMLVVRRRHRRHARVKARAMVGGDEVIHVVRLGMHEMRIVRIAGQQSRSSAGERDENRQAGVVEIAGKPLALHQLAARKAKWSVGRSHEQI